ncbi:MAG TPA: cytochrome c [Beijerinckiaceae bacterium]|jgi:mono/diheme cytochrome c family protein|nr:cytochrome c [Beijerinckiaceae bacterium]
MAFLRMLAPVSGRPPPHALAFPFNIGRGIGLWKRLFLDCSPIAPDPTKSPEWNRGHYLADALGHCAECHTPRNIFGAMIASERYAEGADIEGNGWVPNITPGPDGVAS